MKGGKNYLRSRNVLKYFRKVVNVLITSIYLTDVTRC